MCYLSYFSLHKVAYTSASSFATHHHPWSSIHALSGFSVLSLIPSFLLLVFHIKEGFRTKRLYIYKLLQIEAFNLTLTEAALTELGLPTAFNTKKAIDVMK